MHKIRQDIHIMCELHVTMKLHRAACSLSDADTHFYTIQNIRVRAIFLMSVPLHNTI